MAPTYPTHVKSIISCEQRHKCQVTHLDNGICNLFIQDRHHPLMKQSTVILPGLCHHASFLCSFFSFSSPLPNSLTLILYFTHSCITTRQTKHSGITIGLEIMCTAYSLTSPDSKSSYEHIKMGPPSSSSKHNSSTSLGSLLSEITSSEANTSLSGLSSKLT